MTLLKEWSGFIQGDYCDKHRDYTIGFYSLVGESTGLEGQRLTVSKFERGSPGSRSRFTLGSW